MCSLVQITSSAYPLVQIFNLNFSFLFSIAFQVLNFDALEETLCWSSQGDVTNTGTVARSQVNLRLKHPSVFFPWQALCKDKHFYFTDTLKSKEHDHSYAKPSTQEVALTPIPAKKAGPQNKSKTETKMVKLLISFYG